MTAPRIIVGTAPMLIIADHASNMVPPGIELGVDTALLGNHVAIDIGTAALSEALAGALSAPAIIATVTRLAIDLNRDPAVADVIPAASDGHVIPGNLALSAAERALRIAAIHAPYHAAIAGEIAARRPALMISIHSFTPALATRAGEARPWPIGILYNEDDRAARPGIAALAARGLHVGDNEPYSGRTLNYTMNLHAEGNKIPYLGIEVRNDQIGDAAGVAHWAGIIADTVHHVRRQLG
ncbi:N-formylglutamate amidohydrolase [Polymorphobacter glacialis]|uniref:N-formylglutamate amidohydrolase n=1 Tax=Sandarakinorhabdus glacialis TaxID=1614636 RepID=A0A917E4Z7_9SPHN|nr:N-formylglutamate amidohydrolase [Polymorphobacter glacialis]GGE04931.1 N-formylglutamate amidohydrolase [Polymorphobacter glacialis]